MDKEDAWVMVMNKHVWYAISWSLACSMMVHLFQIANLKSELEFLWVYFQNEFAVNFKQNPLLPTK